MKELNTFKKYIAEGDFKNPILDKYLEIKKSIDNKTVFDYELSDFINDLDNTERKGLESDLGLERDELYEGVINENEEIVYTLYTTNVEYDSGKTGYMYQLVNSEDREENEIGFDQLYFDDEDNRLEMGVDFKDFDQGSYQEGEYTADEAMKLYNDLAEGRLLKEQQEDILSFLKNNKAELIQILANKFGWDEDDIEEQSENEILQAGDSEGNEDPEIAGLGEGGLDFSFNPDKVKDEYGDASNFTIRVGGKTIYGIQYNF